MNYPNNNLPKPILVILNPLAGNCHPAEVRAVIDRQFSARKLPYELVESTNEPETRQRIREAQHKGLSMIVIAGGDGTISGAADDLVRSEIPLGILPVGTVNVLAQELGIPLGLEAACSLLVGNHWIKAVDVMQIGNRVCVSHLSMGFYSVVAEDVDQIDKKRFGRTAYLWAAVKRIINQRTWLFHLTVDEKAYQVRASLILVANAGAVGLGSVRWGADIRPDDGCVDVCVVKARRPSDYFSLVWRQFWSQPEEDPNFHHLVAKETVALRSDRQLPVRADGELIGDSSIQLRVLPAALRVIVPPPGQNSG